jgi:acyl carrier protein
MPSGIDGLGDRIVEFLRKQLGVRDPRLGTATPLVSTGLVDSVDLVRVAGFLEAELGIVIPDGDVTVDHFDSVGSMVAYVHARSAGR